MATLGAAAGTLVMKYGCDSGTSCRGLYIIPMRSSPPRRSFRVSAASQRSSEARVAKKNNAVDTNAASFNSVEVSDSNGEEEPKVVKEEKKPEGISLKQLLVQRLKLDKALDEVVGFMAPREKGDIRDVILMSLSFAVLVYISQRLVCLYCVVRHMAVHTF